MSVDGIDLVVNGEYLTANKTTLGADNGVGIALALASTFFEKLPNIEILFTIKGEVGLVGVYNLGNNLLNLNLDSGKENRIRIGSVGDFKMDLFRKLDIIETNLDKYFKLEFKNLILCHSGLNIGNNLGNIFKFFKKLRFLKIGYLLYRMMKFFKYNSY